jgi:hypothetical protein
MPSTRRSGLVTRKAQVTVAEAVEDTRPLLIRLFGFAALQAMILNKAMSLIVVQTGVSRPPIREAIRSAMH